MANNFLEQVMANKFQYTGERQNFNKNQIHRIPELQEVVFWSR
jgi:hypothetical protein